MGSMQHMLRRAVRSSHLIASGISDWATWSQLFRVVTNNTNYGKETPCKTWKSICLLFSSQSNLNLNSSLIVRDRVRIRVFNVTQNRETKKRVGLTWNYDIPDHLDLIKKFTALLLKFWFNPLVVKIGCLKSERRSFMSNVHISKGTAQKIY